MKPPKRDNSSWGEIVMLINKCKQIRRINLESLEWCYRKYHNNHAISFEVAINENTFSYRLWQVESSAIACEQLSKSLKYAKVISKRQKKKTMVMDASRHGTGLNEPKLEKHLAITEIEDSH